MHTNTEKRALPQLNCSAEQDTLTLILCYLGPSLLSHVDHLCLSISHGDHLFSYYCTVFFSKFLWEFTGMAPCFLMLTGDTLNCHTAGLVKAEVLAQRCILHPDACLFNATKMQSSPLSTLASQDCAPEILLSIAS